MKYILSILTIFSISTLFAQQTVLNSENVINISGDQAKQAYPVIADSSDKIYPQHSISSGDYRVANPETYVGGTTFDLQTNGSNQRRIINQGDGTISLCWMMSHNDNKNPTDRGTGYNYYNGSNWIYNGDDVQTRLESKKSGWPTMLTTKSGKEIIISHNTTDTCLMMLSRNTKGTGAWTQKNLFPGYKLFWNRAVTGGADGNTIHLIAVTLDVKAKGTKFKGIDGALLYSKSTDGGDNWTTPDILPGIDSLFALSISGDSYSIDAKGDTVAVLIGDSYSDVVLMKSTDNGTNWTKKTIYDFPYQLFSEKTTLTPDTPRASDGFTEILLDNSGIAHTWYGDMKILNSKVNDDSLSFFPATNGLIYWNETELNPQIITQALDQDNDMKLTPAKTTNYQFPIYNCGLASMASAGIDASGTIYVVYSAFMENLASPALQNYRHLYAIKSENGGTSWTYPNDITPSDDDSYREYVYPSIAKKVDNYLHIVAMEDDEPGLAVSSEGDPFNVNNIMYLKVSTTLNVAVKEIAMNENTVSVFPNPVSENQVNITIQLEKSVDVKISIYNILSEKISTQSFGKKESGLTQLSVATGDLTSGIYLIEIYAGTEKIMKQLVVR